MGLGGKRALRAKGSSLALLERYSSQMLATARRYTYNLDDAEDAYQRAAEILLTHPPDRPADDMRRWLRTTVKHEAIAISRQRERTVPMGAPELVPEPDARGPDTQERIERFERLRIGAQALGRLKPAEVRCLTLKAEGYTYKEICGITGFSYTKVDRCLKEGRRAFTSHLASIEAGEECARVAPVLSALADGEASPEQVAGIRPHLRGCLACRARLKEYRAAPARVAALVPPAALAAGGSGGLRALLESAAGATQDRVAALGERAHQAAEMAAGQKAVAVAASAAAIAGGGAAGMDVTKGHPSRPAEQVQTKPKAEASEPPAPPDIAQPPATQPTPSPGPPAAAQPRAAPAPPPTAREFSPDAAARAAPATSGGEFSPGGAARSSGGEFGP